MKSAMGWIVNLGSRSAKGSTSTDQCAKIGLCVDPIQPLPLDSGGDRLCSLLYTPYTLLPNVIFSSLSSLVAFFVLRARVSLYPYRSH